VQRRGGTATLVLLTDGRANVARDGRGNRARADEEALAAARYLREIGARVLLVDTSPRPSAPNERLAMQMGARYLPLPYADAATLSRTVQAAR
jgi:magnesium chelatase subunit D